MTAGIGHILNDYVYPSLNDFSPVEEIIQDVAWDGQASELGRMRNLGIRMGLEIAYRVSEDLGDSDDIARTLVLLMDYVDQEGYLP